MLHLDNAISDEFLPYDLRGRLRAWIKEKGLDSLEYLKPEVAIFRLCEALSIQLVERDKFGLPKLSIQDEIKDCGKTGEYQQNKKTGEVRAIGHYCNNRRFHIPCAQRYRRGQAVEMRSQYMEIIKSMRLWGLWHWTFTLPDHVRAWIDDNEDNRADFLKDARRAVSMTIKEVLGVGVKDRKKQPGFSILYHAVSSGNPYRQSSHFHVIALPLLINLKNRSEQKFKKQINHLILKQLYKKHLDQVFKKHQIPYQIKGQYVIHMRYIDARDSRAVGHLFFYNNRSQVDDVLKSIKRVHAFFKSFACVLWDKKNSVYHPEIKDQAGLLDALAYILNPSISIRQSYGFMRVLDRYADMLNIERDDTDGDADDWETLYKIEIRRDMFKVWDEEQGRVIPQHDIFIRRADRADAWRKIKPNELRGERCFVSGKKFYKAVYHGKTDSGNTGKGGAGNKKGCLPVPGSPGCPDNINFTSTNV